MKILHISHKFPPHYSGGAGNSAFFLCKELQKHGHKIKVISADAQDHKDNETNELYENIPITRFKIKSNQLARNFFDYGIYKKVKTIINEWNPDVIHLHSLCKFGLTPLFAIKNFRKKIVAKLPGYYPICARGEMLKENLKICSNPTLKCCFSCLKKSKFLKYLLFRILFLRLTKNAIFLAPSQHIKTMFVKAGYPENKILHFPNFAPNYFFENKNFDQDRLKAQYELKNRKIILYSGSWKKVKGYEYLLKALSLIKNPNIVLVVAGMLDEKEKTRRLIRELKIEIKVKYVGLLDQEKLYQVYLMSDLLIVPSIWPDNAPNVICEALACGLPVIATNVGGLSELIHNEENGFLVPPKDPKAIAVKIDHLLNHPEILQKMRQKVKEFSKNISLKDYTKKLLKIYTFQSDD